MLRHRGARVLRTSAAAAIRRTRRGQPESEPQSPKRIWQRNGGKGMKTKLSPSPFLCLHSFAQNSAVPLPSSHRHRAARCQLPPSACRIRWPMLHRCGARRRFGVPPLGGERHGYARRDNLAVALFSTSRRLKPGLPTKECARSACHRPSAADQARWPMLHRCGARRRFGVPPLGGERHGYARRDNLAVALFFTSRRLKPGLQTKDCARSACQRPSAADQARWPHAAPLRRPAAVWSPAFRR